MKTIFVSDSTLRQAEQQGKALSFREKTAIAARLDALGVNAVELPPLRRAKEDAIIVRTIAGAVKNAAVCLPAGMSEAEIDAAFACIKDAAQPCLQIVIPSSTVQMEYLYHKKAPAMQQQAGELCAAAAKTGAKVELIATDASRAETAFLCDLCRTAEENGAAFVTLCDDAGVMMPEEFAALVKEVKAACSLPVYVQPSNALHMAAATAYAVIGAGADGIKTALDAPAFLSPDELGDIVKAKGEFLEFTCSLAITELHRAVMELGRLVPDAPVETVATDAAVTLSGESSLADVCEAVRLLGYELSDSDNGMVYEEFRRLVAKKKAVNTKELEAIVATAAMQVPSTYHLDTYTVTSGNVTTAMAQISLVRDEVKYSGVSTGEGPIDAAFKAIEQILGHHYELDDFQIQSVTKGREAMGEALVRLRADGKLYAGNGLSTDIVGASIRAYLNALNKIVYEEG